MRQGWHEFSARIGRASCGVADLGTMISRRRFDGGFCRGYTEDKAIGLQLAALGHSVTSRFPCRQAYPAARDGLRLPRQVRQSTALVEPRRARHDALIKWTRLSCRTFAANAVRLQLHGARLQSRQFPAHVGDAGVARQLRRIAIQFWRDISQVSSGGGDYVRANPKTVRIDCTCRHASYIGRRRHHHWTRG